MSWPDAREILAARLDNTGDVVLLGPALRAVKENVPSARVTLLASPGGALAAPLLPWVDEVMTARAVWQDLGARLPLDPEREHALIAEIRARRFDAALIFTSFSQTAHAPGYACYLAGIPLRAGHAHEFGGSVLTTEVRGTPDELHQAERALRLVESVGYHVRDRSLAIGIPPEARSRAAGLLHELRLGPRPFALVHPGASAAARRPPAGLVRASIELMRRSGLDVLVTGTERERAVVDAAAPAGARRLVGRTSVPEYAALVERAAVVLCGNTLPLHLADALHVPVVALYSGTDRESQWTPRDTDAVLLRRDTACHPCYLMDCPIGQPCLDLGPAAVAKEVLDAADRRAACAAAG